MKWVLAALAVAAVFGYSKAVAIGVPIAAAEPVGLVRDIHSYPQYKYSYAVADKITGDRKTATEVRDGQVTKGSYSFVQPDGVLRTVVYTSDPIHGFRAQVINKGVGGHPGIVGRKAIIPLAGAVASPQILG